jgi:predicted ATP-binding protein involved in virulence
MAFSYGINRFRNDSDKKDKTGYLTLFSDEINLESPVKWLQHLDYKRAKGESDALSLEIAQAVLLEILNSEDKEIEIEVTTDKVIFTERGTPVSLDQLSDGYKSTIIWICDLLSRLAESQPEVTTTKDYHGIVLVDEIGAFLHPKWQTTIVLKLRDLFPKIQFFFTTHSPAVLLGASEDAVFYKVYKEDGETKVSQPLDSVSNLTANTILTSPLFGLDSAISQAHDRQNGDLVTEDDYLSSKVHQAVSEKLKGRLGVTSEDEIMGMIRAELDKLEEEDLTDDQH